jgi:hypothetical protein
MSDKIRFALADGLDLARIDMHELWWRYTANGGGADITLLAARVVGAAPCDDIEHDLIAHTLNECFIDRGMDTFPVGYASRTNAHPLLAAGARRARLAAVQLRSTTRGRALEARRRSALTAVQAAALQEASAHLLEASGQFLYARRAYERAANARARAGECIVPSPQAS